MIIKKKCITFFIAYILLIKLNSKVINNYSSLENTSIFIKHEDKNYMSKLNILNLFNVKKNNKKNLIIGAIIKYPWHKIKNFFVSLIKADFENCDIVMYVGKMSNEAVKKIASCGVKVYGIPDKFLKSQTKIHNYRFELYKEFLLKNKDKYNMVFTADVRDTIFQKDIFKFYNEYDKSFIGLSLEDDIIKNEKLNKKWVNYFCPKANIWNETIICSGTILGTIDKFIEFCDALWEFIVKWKDYNIARDQGIVNCLIYDKKILNNYLIAKDNHGPIMTIGLTKREKIFIDKDNNILNYDGQIAAVIHQYDRKLDITKMINMKFNDSNINIYALKKRKKRLNNVNIINYIILLLSIVLVSVIFFFYSFFKDKKIIFKRVNKIIKMV